MPRKCDDCVFLQQTPLQSFNKSKNHTSALTCCSPPKPAKACPGLLWHATACPGLLQPATEMFSVQRTALSLPWPATACHRDVLCTENCSEPALACYSLPRSALACQGMPKPAKVCPGLLQPALAYYSLGVLATNDVPSNIFCFFQKTCSVFMPENEHRQCRWCIKDLQNAPVMFHQLFVVSMIQHQCSLLTVQLCSVPWRAM
jgi:hypothetical protein